MSLSRFEPLCNCELHPLLSGALLIFLAHANALWYTYESSLGLYVHALHNILSLMFALPKGDNICTKKRICYKGGEIRKFVTNLKEKWEMCIHQGEHLFLSFWAFLALLRFYLVFCYLLPFSFCLMPSDLCLLFLEFLVTWTCFTSSTKICVLWGLSMHSLRGRLGNQVEKYLGLYVMRHWQ